MHSKSFPDSSGKETTPPHTRIHRAKWVMVTPEQIIENGAVTVVGDTISKAEPWGNHPTSGGVRVIDHGPGLLTPGLINAHTHLELSAMKGRIQGSGTFLSWVRALIAERDRMDPRTAELQALSAAKELRSLGTDCLADIGSGVQGVSRMREAGLCGWFLWEILGGAPLPDAPLHAPVQDALPCEPGLSLAGHAPHTTPPETLVSAKRRTKGAGLLFSVHLAESEEEAEFIRGGKGVWADFLEERGIALVPHRARGRSPVAYAGELGILDEGTLAVHLRLADRQDLGLIADTRCSVCVCPRSNMHMYGGLPPVENMLKAGIRPALGTDSMASVDDLDLWNEMAFLARRLPNLAPRDILAMATCNGARALQVQKHLGDLTPGKKALMAFVPVDGDSADTVLERAVSGKVEAAARGQVCP